MRTQILSASKGMIKRLSVLMIALCALFASASAQKITITGTVTDDLGEPLPSVSVIEKGQKYGVITDVDGKYSISAASNGSLTFSYVGMRAETVKINGRKTIDVTLETEANTLDELVAIGYGVQKRGTITGAVSTVNGSDLIKTPTMSISNVIGGRVAGIATVQSSGQPGADNAAIYVRGQGNLAYVIDGVRRSSEDFNQLDPNEIESVSVLKDAASVAIYGLDVNGVIIVSTKRGKNEKATVSYTGSFGISQNAEQQRWLDGPGYAYWFNKGMEMDGRTPIFTAEHVEKMKLGIDGWGNTNWYDEVFGTGTRNSHNVSVSGGGDRIQGFASISYLKENGNIENFGFDRWNIRSNVDAKIANGLKASVGISGRLQKQDNPQYSAAPTAYGNIPSQIVRQFPYMPKTIEYNGQEYYTGNISNGMNASVLSSIYDCGYNRINQNYFSSTMSLQWDTPFLEGLSLKFTAGYDASFTFTKQLSNNTPIMLLAYGADKYTVGDVLKYYPCYNFGAPEKYGTPAGEPNIALTENASQSNTFTTISNISYNNKFGLHSVSALALAETRQTRGNNIGGTGYGLDFIDIDELSQVTNQKGDGQSQPPTLGGTSSESRIAGFAARANYNYDDRYFFEASVRRDGSYLFGGMNKRWVTLPGVSAGWRLDREKFFNVDFIQYLKFRAGYGQTATSGVSPFMWRNTVGLNHNQVVFGGQSTSYVSAAGLGNPNLSWSMQDNYNIGVDANMWNGMLGIEVDAFYKYEYDILATLGGDYPPSMGGYYPTYANINKLDHKGFDLTLTHNNRIGKVNYGAKLIWSYAYSRWLYYNGDSDNAPEYQRLTGRQYGSVYGFICTGMYQTQEEIDNAPELPIINQYDTGTGRVAGQPLLGNLKYLDRNGDGKITFEGDMGYVGKSRRPTHTGSLNLFADWNGFDIDVLFVWGLGHEVALTGQYFSLNGIMDHTSYTLPFKWYGNSPAYLVENSWTPEHTDAKFPRLCAQPQNNNDSYASTFWYRNGNYLRLKQAQIGYTVPKKITTKAGINKLRFFVEGFNLLTFSGLSAYNIDPEAPYENNGYYPQQRKMSFGLNVTF